MPRTSVRLLRIMSWRPAATTTTPASSSRGRALTRRIADHFGLSYPQEFTSAASLFIALILLRTITIAYYRFHTDAKELSDKFGHSGCVNLHYSCKHTDLQFTF